MFLKQRYCSAPVSKCICVNRSEESASVERLLARSPCGAQSIIGSVLISGKGLRSNVSAILDEGPNVVKKKAHVTAVLRSTVKLFMDLWDKKEWNCASVRFALVRVYQACRFLPSSPLPGQSPGMATNQISGISVVASGRIHPRCCLIADQFVFGAL